MNKSQHQFSVSMLFAMFLILLVSASFATDAIVAYRSNTGSGTTSALHIRYWNSSGTGTWGAEVVLPTAGSPIRYVVTKISPISNKTVVVTLSDDGYLDAYVCISNCGSAGSWTVSNNIGQVWTTAAAQKRMDVDFESASGDAIVVYSVLNTGITNDLAYKILPAAATSFTGIPEQYIDDTGHAVDVQYTWVDLDCKPDSTSSECILVGFDSTNSDENAWVWDGSAWGNQVSISDVATATGGYQAQAAKYAADGSIAMAVGGHSTVGVVQYKYWNGASWTAGSFDSTSGSLDLRWISMKADPASDDIQAFFVDSGSDLGTAYWNGSTWAVTQAIDTGVDAATTRSVGFEWNPTGSTGILVWDTDTTGTTISTRVCSPQCTAGTVTKSAYAGTGAWLTLYSNPTDADTVNILGLRLNRNFYIGSFYFDGTNYVNYGDSQLTANTVVSTYEAYDLAFYKPPPAVVTLNSPPNNANFSTSSITLNWTPNNFAGNPTCNVTRNDTLIFTGTCTNGVACTTTNTTADGMWSWNVSCTYASTTKSSNVRQFRVDTTAPTTSASAVDDQGLPYTFGTPTTSSYVNVTLSCSDGSGIGCNITQYCTDTTNTCMPDTNYIGVVQISTAGTSYIRYRSNDSLNNLETTKNQTIKIDRTAPALDYTAASVPDNFYTNASAAYFEVAYNESNPDACTLNFNGTASAMTMNATHCYINKLMFSDGYYEYNITLNDTSGNSNTTATRNITRDTTAPAVVINSPVNDSYYQFNNVVVNYTVNDANLNFTNISIYNITGELLNSTMDTNTSAGTRTVTLYVPAGDGYNIAVAAYDLAGNSNTTTSTNVSVATFVPVTTATAVQANGSAYTFGVKTNSTYVNVTLSCEAVMGCDTTLYCLDSTNTCEPATIYSGTIQISTQGTSYIRYRSNDTMGIQEETKNKTIIIFIGVLVTACTSIGGAGTINYVDTNLVAAENESCLAITADDVVVDCEGRSITGSGSPLANTYGMLVNERRNVTIRNCNVTGFASGINLYYSNESAITNVYVSGNTNGVLMQGALLCTISNSTGTGNGVAFYLQDSSNNTLDSLTAYGNGYGVYIFGDSANNNLTNINSYGNDYD